MDTSEKTLAAVITHIIYIQMFSPPVCLKLTENIFFLMGFYSSDELKINKDGRILCFGFTNKKQKKF